MCLHCCLLLKLCPNCGPVPHARQKWHTLWASTSCTTRPRNQNFDVYSDLGVKLRNSDCQIILETFRGILLCLHCCLLLKLCPNCGPVPHARQKWHTLWASTSCTTRPQNQNFDVYSNLGGQAATFNLPDYIANVWVNFSYACIFACCKTLTRTQVLLNSTTNALKFE